MKKYINLLQNLLILLLSVSALFLFIRQQTENPLADFLLSGQVTTKTGDRASAADVTAVVPMPAAVREKALSTDTMFPGKGRFFHSPKNHYKKSVFLLFQLY